MFTMTSFCTHNILTLNSSESISLKKAFITLYCRVGIVGKGWGVQPPSVSYDPTAKSSLPIQGGSFLNLSVVLVWFSII